MFDLPVFENERDCEIPLLLSFLQRNLGRFNSVLDVGCSFAAYTPKVRLFTSEYSGIDLLEDEKVVPNLDKFYKEDFLTAELPYFDIVFSVSTIEHIGVEYLPTKLYRELQVLAFQKMVNLARHGVFVTFPYGEAILFDGKYNNIDRTMVYEMEAAANRHYFTKSFYSVPYRSDWRSASEVWQKVADTATNELAGGVLTICVLEVIK